MFTFKKKLRLEKENVFKNKHTNLKILIKRKNDFACQLWRTEQNVEKRKRHKKEKIKNMENLLLELQSKF